jgi:hypothetical protein
MRQYVVLFPVSRLLLRPKFFLTSLRHLTLALGAGMLVPYPDVIAATL